MDPLHHQTIQKNYGYLMDHLEVPLVLDIFISKSVIQIAEKDNIQSGRTKRDQNHEFVSLITKRGPKAYDVFLKALRETSQEFIAGQLEYTYNEIAGQCTETESDSIEDWLYSELPAGVTQQPVSERELVLVSRDLAGDMRTLGCLLGFNAAQVEQVMQSHPSHMQAQANKLFLDWKYKEGGAATIEKFVKHLREFRADDDKVKKVIISENQVQHGEGGIFV